MEEKLKEIFDKEYSTSKLEDFTIKTQKVYEILNYDFKLKSRNLTQYNISLAFQNIIAVNFVDGDRFQFFKFIFHCLNGFVYVKFFR